jgi:hypothetical protein
MEFGAAEPYRAANRGGVHPVKTGPHWRQSPGAAAGSLLSPPGPAKPERRTGQWRLGRPLRDRLPARRAGVARDLAVHVVPAEARRRHGLSLVRAVRCRTIRCFRHCILLGDTGSGQAGHARSGWAASCPRIVSHATARRVRARPGGSDSPPDRAATVRASVGASDPGPGRCRPCPAYPSVAATGSARRSLPRTSGAPRT